MRTLTRPAPPKDAPPDRRVLGLAFVSGATFVVATLLARTGEPLPFEIAVFRWVNGLPDWLFYVIWPFMQYGVFVTIPVAAAVAFVASRRRLSLLLATSGLGIYYGAKAVKDIVRRGRPGAFLADVHAREHFAPGSLGYTSGHLAVAATIATLTVFHLHRPWREISVALVAIVAFGRMYIGGHLPLDLVGGVAMGVATGAATTYFFGSDPNLTEEEPPMADTLRSAVPSPTPVGDDIDPGPPIGRHPGDALRIAIGLVVLGLAALAVQRDRLTRFEGDLFHLVNHLPSQLEPVLQVVMQAGNVVAALVAAVVMLLVARQYRRAAFDVALAGGLAWIAARELKNLVQRPRPIGFFDDVLRYSGGGLGFVSGHTAVATAIATAAAPYLPRRWRRALWLLPFVVGFTRIYFGAHLPLDVVGGGAVGWVVGATIHLALGAPHRVPGLDEAAAVLRRAGWADPSDLHRVPGAPRGSFPFVATTADGPVFVKLLDPEPRDRDWIYRVARFLAFRDVRDEVAVLDAPTQAHREAAMTLLARNHGARVPAIHGIEHDGDRVWLVEDHIAGRDLDRLPAGSVTDAVLLDVWEQVARIHGARVAHRDLVTSNVLVDDLGEAWIVDFAHAQSAASPRALDNDVAELLATTSMIVGPERAVAAARAVLGVPALRRALPELQELPLTAETRRRLRRSGDALGRLRHEVATNAGLELPAEVSPERSPVRHLLATVLSGLVAAVGLVLVAGPGALFDELSTPGYRWLGVAVLALVLAEISRASGLLAAIDRRLAVGRTTLAQVSAFSSAVLDSRQAGRDELTDHLEQAGVPRSEGRRGLRYVRRTGLVCSAVALTLAAVAGRNELLDVDLPDQATWLVLLAVVAAGAPLLGAGRRHDAAAPPLERPDRRAPGWPVLALAGSGETTTRLVCALAAAAAMGGGAPLAGVAVVHLVSTGLESRGPVSGAPGLGEVVMAAGLVAFGMALAPAVAAALTIRALLVWAPVLVGRLLRHGPKTR
jgi:undecaprenyl-diphosphatase